MTANILPMKTKESFKMNKVLDIGHWTSLWNPSENIPWDLTNKYGFVYVITNVKLNKKYIGCKAFYFKRGNKIKESDWKSYTGSNTQLNKDIEIQGKQDFTFYIVQQYNTKVETKYHEARLIMMNNAIYDNGFYNEFLSIKMKGKKK